MSDLPITPAPDKKPGGVIIYDAYRAGMIAFYLGFVLLGAWAYTSKLEPQEGGTVMGLSIALIGLVCCCLFAGSFFLPRKPWAWNVHMVLIALGLVGVISTPCALFVGVFWFRQDSMAWFGQQLTRKEPPAES